jgi:hypothetical protein
MGLTKEEQSEMKLLRKRQQDQIRPLSRGEVIRLDELDKKAAGKPYEWRDVKFYLAGVEIKVKRLKYKKTDLSALKGKMLPVFFFFCSLFASAQTTEGYDQKYVKLRASYSELVSFVAQVKDKHTHVNFYSQTGLKTNYGQDGTYILKLGRSENHHFITTTYTYYLKKDTVFMMEIKPNKGNLIELSYKKITEQDLRGIISILNNVSPKQKPHIIIPVRLRRDFIVGYGWHFVFYYEEYSSNPIFIPIEELTIIPFKVRLINMIYQFQNSLIFLWEQQKIQSTLSPILYTGREERARK